MRLERFHLRGRAWSTNRAAMIVLLAGQRTRRGNSQRERHRRADESGFETHAAILPDAWTFFQPFPGTAGFKDLAR